MSSSRARLTLGRLEDVSSHQFMSPLKRINDGHDLDFFFTTTGYHDLTKWLLQLNRAMFPAKTTTGTAVTVNVADVNGCSGFVDKVRNLLDELRKLLERAPPETGPRRFGNVAFRKWYQLVEENAILLLRSCMGGLDQFHACEGSTSDSAAALLDELKAYLLGSFGSSQRLDYGTGHELSFLAFLGCLWKLGGFQDGEETTIVCGIIQPYLELVRKLIMTYTLEPAGSHGVWGLDDHSFLPYIFGSAQLGPAIDRRDYHKPVPTEGSLPGSPSPSTVVSQNQVADYKDKNMYFSAIQFIYDVKRGPFWEHSPVLYDISGIKDGWGKINKGMLKMYAAEVLGKFPVVQHFPFGSLFEWQRDPEAQKAPPSVHSQQQQEVATRANVPASAGGVSNTAAPWAKTATMPQMQSSTGMPTTRAPWASAETLHRPQASPSTSLTPATAAPWAARQRQPPPGS